MCFKIVTTAVKPLHTQNLFFTVKSPARPNMYIEANLVKYIHLTHLHYEIQLAPIYPQPGKNWKTYICMHMNPLNLNCLLVSSQLQVPLVESQHECKY